ncbi:hypothetical protein P4105_01325 [Pseudomonas aeruginosa]|uniref:hypothetical protein n=1 Tax=Pseudomonas aeruginosa TaxID=287 RepID=UPI002E2CF10F|nr:hypothetical protein [Pseudomonas aeruginosa]MDF5927930.1 hypothetical protein [Pseudomonas aeruginosa]MDF5957503.1 hypothetical protein [Pseudomonas aeruginosa]
MGNHLVQLLLTQATFWLCVGMFLRLFTYQRGKHAIGSVSRASPGWLWGALVLQRSTS